MDTHQPYWGPPTASVDWCERNYEVCNFVAEFWNTVSSASIAILGLVGLYLTNRENLEKRFGVLYIGIIVVGLGSVAFHGTLLLGSQLLDELPMIWSTLTWLYIYQTMESPAQGNPGDKRLATSLAVFGVVWGVASPWVHYYTPTAFRALFVGLLGYSLYKAYFYWKICENQVARKLYLWCNVFLVAGVTVWLLDLHACNQLHYLFGDYWWHKYVGSLHGYWHCFMALNVYLGPTVTATIRAQMLDRPASIHWWGGILPYVSYDKKNMLLLMRSGDKVE